MKAKTEMYPAGKVNFADDGDTAYIWTHDAWMASLRMVRGDMSEEAFRRAVDKVVALAKAGAL